MVRIKKISSVFAALCLFILPATAQHGPVRGHIMTPKSSMATPGAAAGKFYHTHLQIFVPDSNVNMGPPFPGFAFETPASIACLYGLAPHVRGCNPNVVSANPTGGKGVIAIVDAFDDPNAAADLATFSKQFGLPAANFAVVYANGTKPGVDPSGGWEVEESLDIEWAHAMAPKAKILLVEAASNSGDDLFNAEIVAGNLVSSLGGGEVSNSWGGEEFDQEAQLDFIFQVPGVVFFASTGDAPGTQYPSTSPNVVAAGGTTTARSPFTGDFLYELPWAEAGGGPSQFEPRPHYQNVIRRVVGDTRGVPDMSFDANPDTGVWVWDSNPLQGQPSAGWLVVGGTSVSSPSLAGVVNSTGRMLNSSTDELSLVYNNLGNPFAFNDIKFGYCGPYAGFLAEPGWDFCTGVGSVNGKFGK